MKEGDAPIVVEEAFAATRDAVWEAITVVDQMRQWYFGNIPAFEPEVGFETRFDVRSGERNFRHVWNVTEVDPGRRIAYGWRFDGFPGDASVEFDLSERGDTTVVKLTARVTGSFPDGVPEFETENCIAGWDYFIRHSLKRFLEGS